MHQLLILVHPGSLCGSADFNLGRSPADGIRDCVAHILERHDGPFLVVDGGMEDELEDHDRLRAAIDDCLRRNEAAGHRSGRFDGPDDAMPGEHFTDTLPAELTTWREALGDASVTVTGAWYHLGLEGGCVNTVHSLARGTGFTRVDICDSAACLDDDDRLDDDHEEEEDDEEEFPLAPGRC